MYDRLDELGDPWRKLVDFERFRLILEECWRPANAGDITMMEALVDPRQKREPLWLELAYRSEEEQKALRAEKIRSRIAYTRSKGVIVGIKFATGLQ